MEVFPGAGVREAVYARRIWTARLPSPGVWIDTIRFRHGHLIALVLVDLMPVGV